MPTREPVWLPRPQGTDRPGDPVLTMTGEQKAVFIEAVHYGWFLTGYSDAPIGKALAGRRHHPRPGDLVMISDALDRRATSTDDKSTQLMGLGYLVETRLEPSVTEEVWAQYGESDWDGECPRGDAHYIQYGPNAADVCRWENATVQAVPRGGEFAKQVQEDARAYLR